MCIVGLTPLDHSSPDRDDGMRAACGVNAVIPVGNTISRVSAHRAVGEHDLQLAEDHIPILTLGNIHEYKGINTCKGRFCQALTSGAIFSLILLTSSGEISTSYRLLIGSAMSRRQ